MDNKTTLKNLFIGILFLMIATMTFSQNVESSTRIFIENAKFTRINRNWRIIAEFKSGIGESVKFYPIEVINLKTGEKTKALQLDMNIKNPSVFKTAWVGIEEINELISFIEKHVIPNSKLKFNNTMSSEFIFTANEVTLLYLVYENKKRLTIKLNSYDDFGFKNYTFWTETQVNKIPKILEILKNIK